MLIWKILLFVCIALFEIINDVQNEGLEFIKA